MTPLIRKQLEIIVKMFAGGISAGIVQSVFAKYSKYCLKNKLGAALAEIFAWIVTGFLLGEFLYNCDNGKLSLEALGAAAAGLLLWKKMFCDILARTGGHRNEETGRYKRISKKRRKKI